MRTLGKNKQFKMTFVLFRGQIDSKQCRFKVRKTTIEILAKKLIPIKWLSLEKLTHEGKAFSEREKLYTRPIIFRVQSFRYWLITAFKK